LTILITQLGYAISEEQLIALMMGTASTPETLVEFYQTTWSYIPEDIHLNRFYFPGSQSFHLRLRFPNGVLSCGFPNTML
jgi:hypothetical protein